MDPLDFVRHAEPHRTLNTMRKNDFPIDERQQELSPAEQFEVLVPFARMLVDLGVVPGLTVEKFDEVAEQIIATGRGGQANERA